MDKKPAEDISLKELSELRTRAAELAGQVEELRKSEAALRESEVKCREFADFLPQPVFELDGKGYVTFYNRAASEISGYGEEDVRAGLNVLRLIVPEDVARVKEHMKRVLSGATIVDEEYTGLKKDGTEYPIVVYTAPAFRGGMVTGIRAIIVDFTGRKRVEDEINKYRSSLEEMVRERTAELRESEEKFRGLVENAPVGIGITKPGGEILDVNPAICRMLGFDSKDEILKSDVASFYSRKEDRGGFLRLIERGPVKDFKVRLRRRDGSGFWASITSTMVRTEKGPRIISILEDITERKRLEEQLIQSQKMEAVGRFAGGIAHDFNNRLAAIMNYGYLLKNKMKADDPLRDYVEGIIAFSGRAASLARSLLTIGGRREISMRPISLNELVGGIEKFLLRTIGEDVQLKASLAEEEMTVMADEGQMENVLMNLATNARDAMPRGGLLSIRTESIHLGGEFIEAHGYGVPGRYACISMTDTGSGMDEETKNRIFEPFFTTKEAGKGTGLGLSISYWAVKRHNGYINVYSEPGAGTTFRVYLPLVWSGAVERVRERAVSAVTGGGETVLLAEDDDDVRTGIKYVLRESGYEVIEARDGREAVRAFAENKEKIGILLFDVIMPGMRGEEAYEEIKKMRPSIAALFISGYSPDVLGNKSLVRGGLNFLSKPVPYIDLLGRIRLFLDEAAGIG